MHLINSLKNKYGSKVGFLRSMKYLIAFYIGRFRQHKNIDLSGVRRLIFICHGNICRSPLGEVVAKTNGFDAISYGLDTRGNAPADPRAVAFARSVSLDLSPHLTRRIEHYQPVAGDLLIGMEPHHAYQLKEIYGNRVPITLIGLWLNKPIPYLHDPYSANTVYFNYCEENVVKATQSIITKIKRGINNDC